MGANNFADATVVDIETDGATYTDSGVDNSAFTMESGEPLPTGFSSGKSAWWSYTPLAGGSVTAHTGPTTTTGAGVDTELAVYTGSAVGALTKLASNSDGYSDNRRSQLTFTATAGTTYRIQVTAYLSVNMAYGLSVTGPATTAPPPPEGALSAVLPVAFTGLVGTAPTPGALAFSLPVPVLSLSGSSPIPGVLAFSLPVVTVAAAGITPPPRTGYGLVLDSTSTVDAEAPLPATPSDSGVAAIPLHVVTPTVPTPTLVNGRPS